MLVDFGESGPTGKEVQEALNKVGIIVNKNTVPRETRKPFVTSGIRLGTPAVTTRGMKERQMLQIGNLISKVIENLGDEKTYRRIAREVKDITNKFPIPQHSN
jgi:glycine hydroxymethyltransferase